MATRFKRDWFTGELVEETFESSPTETGRSVIFRETLKYGSCPLSRQDSVRLDKPHISRSLGIHPLEVDKFNAKLREFGVEDASYNKKTGFLHSTSRQGKAEAWAIRGHYDKEGGSIEQKIANAIGY